MSNRCDIGSDLAYGVRSVLRLLAPPGPGSKRGVPKNTGHRTVKTPVQRDQESGPFLGLVFEAPDWAPMMGARSGLRILRPKNAHDPGFFWTSSQNDFGTDAKTVFSTHHGTLQRARVTLSNIKQTCHQCVCVFDACEHEREYEVQVFLSFWVCETLVRSRVNSKVSIRYQT